jgi:RNA polymerase sigma factor (sigma-70 family)
MEQRAETTATSTMKATTPNDGALQTVRRAGELIALARARRAYELGRLPGWPGWPGWGSTLSPRLRQQLREHESGVSTGTLVAILRYAMRQRQPDSARDLFLLLLERVEAANTFWARQTVQRLAGSAPAAPAAARMIEEDLCQELTLHLWEELALHDAEGWELFFRRSLAFARSQVAARVLARHGYRPGLRVVRFFSEIAAHLASDDDAADIPSLADSRDGFSAADLADLRGYVGQLPPRERAAVVMRYWQHAREQEIADALGVTTRTVRNLLRRALGRLQILYTGGITDVPPEPKTRNAGRTATGEEKP